MLMIKFARQVCIIFLEYVVALFFVFTKFHVLDFSVFGMKIAICLFFAGVVGTFRGNVQRFVMSGLIIFSLILIYVAKLRIVTKHRP